MSDTDSEFETGATGRKLAQCQRQLAEAQQKALLYDLDQLGIQQRYRDSVELVELRAALAEARAALRDNPIEVGRPMYAIDAMEWLEKHAAALKAARQS